MVIFVASSDNQNRWALQEEKFLTIQGSGFRVKVKSEPVIGYKKSAAIQFFQTYS